MDRRAELADFLKARRAATQPEDVGMSPRGRRRTPGQRREEVALLAGVSVAGYTWLEQGRRINASRDVIAAVARALRMSDAERDHLLTLAEVGPASAPADAAVLEAPDALVALLHSMQPAPAYLLGPRWEFLAWNRAQSRLYPAIDTLPDDERNLVWVMFTRADARQLVVDWESEAHQLLAEFRAGLTNLGRDDAADELVERLRDTSAEFAAWWVDHDVARFQTRLRRYRHPRAGALTFQFQQLTPSEWPLLRLVVQLPIPGDDSAQRLADWHEVA